MQLDSINLCKRDFRMAHIGNMLVVFVIVGFVITVDLWAQDKTDYRVLPADFNADKEQQMMRAYQRPQVHAALDTRLKELEAALASPDAIAAYQRKRQAYLTRVFGPLPDRGPLNAQVMKRLQRNDYLIEHVLFESLPGFYVTANLYRPAGEGPFPGVLLPCGHAANGKAYTSYQKASILLAKNGFVVLCFDPLGQGERRQLIGNEPHQIIKPGNEHNPIGVAPILLGRSIAAMMVWDGMRAIDYLCSRPDVDAKRIGCTGNSGGGNLTSYLMAFDERIVAAAPGCFMTTHRRKNESPGPGDAEQNLHAQIRDGFDHPDFILSRAPKPTLILAATHDYVPIAGTWEAFRQAKRVYTVLGHPERVEILETNDKHGFSRRMREGMVRFMARWLQHRQVVVFEDENVPTLSEEMLQVTPHGQVRWLPNTRSVFDLYTESERNLAAKRPPLTAKVVRTVTGIRSLEDLPRPLVKTIHSKNSAIPKKLIIRPEPGIVLPALYFPGGSHQPILIAPGDGMNSAVEQAREWHDKGHPVLIVEVRDTGETSTRNWRFPGADSFIGHMLGRSWLTMRAEDLLVSARWLAETTQQEPTTIHATGEAVPAALHARYLEPDLIDDVQTVGGLTSWRELMTSRQGFRHIHQVVYGALKFYDLPDLQKPSAKKDQ
ncbi:alpha/beta hydrolase family protein [Thalassoroseus pseudoceratinae]|uniref:alpha/beta hydrolase family protein n=1 Tax=Thalassoroseus pseudoceratinae TaxID=2713176 RepID=UPI001422D5B6|nr:prolyl oligopeptidase family serine peptidase [Thalassoroseus pseudoceratinae]